MLVHLPGVPCGRVSSARLLVSSIGLVCGLAPAVAQQALPTIDVGARTPHRATSPTHAPRSSVDVARAPAPRPVVAAPVAAPAIAPVTPAPVIAASERRFSGAQVNARPFSRPAEALEIVPGLVITQHSGEGKANQYFLRGFNLDHGSDLALTLDGMPLNMRTHGHAQGYADANFLMPELLSSVVARKGPYYADEGDFSSAGAVRLQYVDRLDQGLFLATGGGFAYGRLFGAKSYALGDGNLLAALETNVYDGPWRRPDEARKINGVMRWSRGTQEDGMSLTAMAYANRWYATNQIAQRAVQSGLLSLWDNLNDTDGGDTTRFSVSGRWSQREAQRATRIEAYAIRQTLDLYNDHTYFLSQPDIGDQFRQFDRRTILGVNARHAEELTLGDMPVEARIGLQGRYDDIRLGLQNTFRRQSYETVRNDGVAEGSLGLWADATLHVTPWLRAMAGGRVDFYRASIGFVQDPAAVLDWTGPFNSGARRAAIGSPKIGAAIGPFYETELFLDAGEGFHSTDARGAVQKVDPADGSYIARIPLLVKSRGAEIGLRTRAIATTESAVALFWLDFDSENQFSGDSGGTIYGRPSRRLGVEWTNHWAPASWLRFDGDVTMTHARFRGFDQPQAVAWGELLAPDAIGYGTFYGNAPGNFLSNAPNVIASASLELGEQKGWFGALRYRYFGPRPLTEDGAFYSPATGLLNARLGYRFDNGWRIQADAFNIFNSRSDQITYAYGSLLKTDALYGLCQAGQAPASVCGVGVMDRHFKPVEPPTVRVTIGGPF